MTSDNAEWGDETFTEQTAALHWLAPQEIRSGVNERITGDPELDWLTFSEIHYLEPLAAELGRGIDCAVLGSGMGWIEEKLAGAQFLARIDGFEIDEGAVRAATKRLEHLDKVSFSVADLNLDPLPRAYDVVIAHSALHHVDAIEDAAARIAAALPPHGLLLFNEYVGPNRLQYSTKQLHLVNGLLQGMEEGLRRVPSGEVLEHLERPGLEFMIAHDPSEAPRSTELFSIFCDAFQLDWKKEYGGTLLQPLLWQLPPNFSDHCSLHRAVLALLQRFELSLVDLGVIPSDYVYAIFRKKGSPRLRGEAGASAPGVVVKPAGGEVHSDYFSEPVGREMNVTATGCPDLDWPVFLAQRARRLLDEKPTVLLLLPVDYLKQAFLGADCCVVEANRYLRDDGVEVVRGLESLRPGSVDLIVTCGQLAISAGLQRELGRFREILAPGGFFVLYEQELDGEPKLASRLATDFRDVVSKIWPPAPDADDEVESRKAPSTTPRKSRQYLLHRTTTLFDLVEFRPLGGELLRPVCEVLQGRATEEASISRLVGVMERLFLEAGVPLSRSYLAVHRKAAAI